MQHRAVHHHFTQMMLVKQVKLLNCMGTQVIMAVYCGCVQNLFAIKEIIWLVTLYDAQQNCYKIYNAALHCANARQANINAYTETDWHYLEEICAILSTLNRDCIIETAPDCLVCLTCTLRLTLSFSQMQASLQNVSGAIMHACMHAVKFWTCAPWLLFLIRTTNPIHATAYIPQHSCTLRFASAQWAMKGWGGSTVKSGQKLVLMQRKPNLQSWARIVEHNISCDPSIQIRYSELSFSHIRRTLVTLFLDGKHNSRKYSK